jgi:hypothetical protein
VASRQRAWVLIVFVAAICGGLIWGVAWWRGSRLAGPADYYRLLPSRDALVVYVDFKALRQAGILQLLTESKVAQDPEYQHFVRSTDFDYRQDLEAVMAAFAPSGKYFLVKGRFEWKTLRKYVKQENGTCYNSVCRMAGSTADRRISFLPVRPNVMGMAVSTDESAALRLTAPGSAPETALDFPADPVWIFVPPAMLKAADSLPTGTRMFARGMENAERVVLSLGTGEKNYAIRLNVLCRSAQDAVALAGQLHNVTVLLREMIEREHHTPNPADLSGVLCSGSFRSEGLRVLGYWPIERRFLQNMLAGGGA